jgi:hypothetical protein
MRIPFDFEHMCSANNYKFENNICSPYIKTYEDLCTLGGYHFVND